MKEDIRKYYNEIAHEYDVSRFSNSYGKYIDYQENRILMKYLAGGDISENLDLACGTGRFLRFANYGLDYSEEMVKISQSRFPDKNIIMGDAEILPFDDAYFRNVLSFHLFMHLDLVQFQSILSEVCRATKKGGYFIFDIPSAKRRKLTRFRSKSWHGGNQIDLCKMRALLQDDKWELVAFHGISFFPVHRIPKKLRRFFVRLDIFFCDSLFKEYASHLVFVLKRN